MIHRWTGIQKKSMLQNEIKLTNKRLRDWNQSQLLSLITRLFFAAKFLFNPPDQNKESERIKQVTGEK